MSQSSRRSCSARRRWTTLFTTATVMAVSTIAVLSQPCDCFVTDVPHPTPPRPLTASQSGPKCAQHTRRQSHLRGKRERELLLRLQAATVM